MVLSQAIVGRHFNMHYSLVCGIGHTGQALALLAFAPLMQLFLDTYGWRGATLLMAGICMHVVPCAALVKESHPQYQAVQDQSYDTAGQGSDSKSALLGCCRLLQSADLGILLEFKYWMVYMCRFSINLLFDAWLLYYVPHMQAKGFSPQTATTMCSAAAVGYLIGTVIWAPALDRGLLKCSTAIIISSLALSLSFIGDPWVNSVWASVISALNCGTFSSAMYTLSDVFVKEAFGTERLTSAFGWIRPFFFIPRFLAGFLPGKSAYAVFLRCTHHGIKKLIPPNVPSCTYSYVLHKHVKLYALPLSCIGFAEVKSWSNQYG